MVPFSKLINYFFNFFIKGPATPDSKLTGLGSSAFARRY